MGKLIEKLRGSGKPILILICGMPGTRKSSTAVRLGAVLGFSSVVGMDEVRDVMLLYDKRPILRGKSHDRWRLFGSLDTKNFIKGYLGHSRALKQGAMAIIRKNLSLGENTIVEGVHLAPFLYNHIANARKFHFLLVTKDFNHHKNLLHHKFDRRHAIQKPWTNNKIRHVEKIQEFLINDAQKNKAIIIFSKNPEENCKKIIRYLEKEL